MIVRIKLKVGPRIYGERNLDSKLAFAASGVLTPGSVLCFVIALWRLLCDLDLTGAFMIDAGLLSHWQVWLAMGILMQTLSVYLDRYGRRVERHY
ncbi:hypothetical protein [Bryobacter aggregatus]|uniref:hypothetical protein n=1 Tax=Bryobacter aggregatus TaxID=360054 RepID=UPI0004E1C73E|nr:hypothetical protein [Bryobacter aggregatus]